MMKSLVQLTKGLRLFKKLDYYIVLISVVLITLGTSWMADESNEFISGSAGFNGVVFSLGILFTIIGTWLAKLIALQLSRPNPDSFKAIEGAKKQQEINDTELVIMGLSTLADEAEALKKLEHADWATLCSETSIKAPAISWQQNIRTIKNFISSSSDVEFIILCSHETDRLFPSFERLIKRLSEETGQNIDLKKAEMMVDINSLASCSEGIKKILNGHASSKTVIDITSGTKQYSAACTLETTYRDSVYLGYVSNDANYFIYNVLNEERGEIMM